MLFVALLGTGWGVRGGDELAAWGAGGGGGRGGRVGGMKAS